MFDRRLPKAPKMVYPEAPVARRSLVVAVAAYISGVSGHRQIRTQVVQDVRDLATTVS